MTIPADVLAPLAQPARRQPSRRNLELVLLVFAWGIGLLGCLQVSWANGEDPTSQLWIAAGVVGALALAMHAAIRWRAPGCTRNSLIRTASATLSFSMRNALPSWWCWRARPSVRKCSPPCSRGRRWRRLP